MPGEVLTRIIRIEGIEPGAIPLEEYANLLRDLVFVHDRLWLIANQEHFRERLYFSSFFYARDQRRVLQTLQLISAEIGSPFKLDISVNVDDWAKGIANAFIDVVRAVATLPSYIENEKQLSEQQKLRTRQMRARTHRLENEARVEISKRRSTGLIVARPAVQALNSENIPDWEKKLLPLEKDIQRLAQSPLKITGADELLGDDKTSAEG
jgi:hypothetical protein